MGKEKWYKNMSCYGILLDPGPGDALRFLHGFCELLKKDNETGIVFCLPMAYRNVKGLFSGVDQDISLVKCMNIPEINQYLNSLPKSIIWYCYDIEYINWDTKKLPQSVTENTRHEYYMIDRYQDHKYMAGKVITHLQIQGSIKQKKALLFLRKTHVCPERNMNSSILEEIVNTSKEYGIIYDVVGNKTEEWDKYIQQIQGTRLFSDGYPDYLTQMKVYINYLFAIGMNSGGLDLAIAAGVPAIRIGEFHQYYDWLGAHYNDFLSSACTVNIASKAETDVSNIKEQQIQKAINIVLQEAENKILWISTTTTHYSAMDGV